MEVFFLARENRLPGAGSQRPPREELRQGDTLHYGTLMPLLVKQAVFDSTSPTLFFAFTIACPHCRKSTGIWKELWRSVAKNSSVQMAGVSLDDSIRTVQFALEETLEMALYMPKEKKLFQEANRILGVPQTVLVDGDGRARRIWSGELTREHLSDIAKSIAALNRKSK